MSYSKRPYRLPFDKNHNIIPCDPRKSNRAACRSAPCGGLFTKMWIFGRMDFTQILDSAVFERSEFERPDFDRPKTARYIIHNNSIHNNSIQNYSIQTYSTETGDAVKDGTESRALRTVDDPLLQKGTARSLPFFHLRLAKVLPQSPCSAT